MTVGATDRDCQAWSRQRLGLAHREIGDGRPGPRVKNAVARATAAAALGGETPILNAS